MNVEPRKIKVKDVYKGYTDNGSEGITGYDGKLDIRPPYQREFIYNEKRRNAVIDTVMSGYPLNVMYWAVRDDGTYEVMDGQQRTISICKYIDGEFPIKGKYFHNLYKEEREAILNYELDVYLCSGPDTEKLDWFKTINIAGLKLTNQELRNAVYAGPWLLDAKKYFSKNGCPAYRIAFNYIHGSPIRQDFLETALKWISKGKIEQYMAEHQHDENANELWLYFQSVIAWVKATFPEKYNSNRVKYMRSVDWGSLYDKYKDAKLGIDALEAEVSRLLLDDDVTNKAGIYPYVLDGEERHLSIRTFTPLMKYEAYERQEGKCAICGEEFELGELEADHIIPWSKGGKTTIENCQLLCASCHAEKTYEQQNN